MANLGKFGSIGAAAISFISEHLEYESTKEGGPRLYKIEQEFSLFLQKGNVSELVANETAVKQREFVWGKLREQIVRWQDQGVMPPYIENTEEEDTLFTWRHARYKDISGSYPLSESFFAVYRWLSMRRESEFLVPCLGYLRAIGCDPIYATDGGGDEGIDCIGIIESGALRGTALFVQAKSRPCHLGADELLREYGKFIAMRRTERYFSYLDALGVRKSRTGAADLYILISNSDLKLGSAKAAHKLGALIRTRRQMAQTLSEYYTFEDLQRFLADPKISRAYDPAGLLNVAPMLAPSRSGN